MARGASHRCGEGRQRLPQLGDAAYLRGRPNLQRVLLLLDAKVGIKDADETLMDLMDESGLSYQAVMTKADNLKPAERRPRRYWSTRRVQPLTLLLETLA